MQNGTTLKITGSGGAGTGNCVDIIQFRRLKITHPSALTTEEIAEMTQEPGQGPQKDGRSQAQSLLWYLMLVAAAILAALLWLVSNQHDEIAYDELLDLIEANRRVKKHGALVEGASGKIVVVSINPTRETTYTNLHSVFVGQQAIRGLVDRKVKNGTGKKEGVAFRTYLGSSESQQDEVRGKLTAAKLVWRNEGPPSVWKLYGPTFLVIGALVLMFVFMIRRIGGAGSPMQFGRSRGKLYAMEELAISFNEVAGIDEAVEEVREVVDFLRTPEKYQKLGGRIPKGVLLVGPPGTGKTLLARAIAGEAGVPFFGLSGSDFVEMFVGVGAARVRDMFQQAEAKAPCIIFIDELDALGKSRGGGMPGGHDEREQTLNALLVEMDGFDSNRGVIVLAATNRPETLDQALLRPGRFDRNVLVDRPDVLGREEILKVHVKNVKLDPTVDLKKVAKISPGLAGADLANLVNEAALLAARADKSAVGMDDFDESVERVTAGLEKKQRVMRPEEKKRVAYHESGHALVALSLPNTDPVHKISIIPRGYAALGYVMQRPDGDRYLMTKSELESEIQTLLAGTLAEEMIYSDISSGAQNDLERATDIARRMVMEYGMSGLGRVNYRDSKGPVFLSTSPRDTAYNFSETTSREIDLEVKKIIDESIEKVREILRVRQKALVAVTERLIEIESISGDELRQIVEENSPGPVLVPGTDAANRTRDDDAKPTQFPKSDEG
ncbi:MAG TPA: ATP-dependent zinc metalloprotease FtsH [Planctomycetaceae bacterium]|nr:ATP-dependent zinc metalloprotease FtsH [Planctomycetaceae bacterium]